MKHLTDSQIIQRYRTNATPADKKEIEGEIFRRHFGLVKTIANAFPITGIDAEDRAAECIPAFLKGIREYDPDNTTSLKTFLKMCVKRKLIDLHRSTFQASEIPYHSFVSLDEAASEEGDIKLEDIIASTDDVQGELETTVDVVESVETLRGLSFDLLIEAVNQATRKNNPRLIDSFKLYAIHAEKQGYINRVELADILELLTEQTLQATLFDLAPARDSTEAEDLIQRAFKAYVVMQTAILFDVAEGYLIPEISTRHNIPTPMISKILAAIREVRQVEPVDELLAA